MIAKQALATDMSTTPLLSNRVNDVEYITLLPYMNETFVFQPAPILD
jgi:hypothetical protein